MISASRFRMSRYGAIEMRFAREAGERRAPLRREDLDGLFHRARKPDELECGVHAAPGRRLADGLHRIRCTGIDRDRAEAFRERELRGIDVATA